MLVIPMRGWICWGLNSKVYGEKDGKELEDDIENLLIENDISHTRNRKIYDESGKVLGEIDIETDSHIIETTVSKKRETYTDNKI